MSLTQSQDWLFICVPLIDSNTVVTIKRQFKFEAWNPVSSQSHHSESKETKKQKESKCSDKKKTETFVLCM